MGRKLGNEDWEDGRKTRKPRGTCMGASGRAQLRFSHGNRTAHSGFGAVAIVPCFNDYASNSQGLNPSR
jgi:hypothetical protein